MNSMTTRITVNGQTYASVEKMPPDVRRQYELAMGLLADKDGNGIPDILEGKQSPLATASDGTIKPAILTNVTTSRIIVNGKEYSNWEDVPAAIRDALEKAQAAPETRAAIQTKVFTTKGANVPADPFASDGGIKISLTWLILLLLAAIGAGIVIAVMFLR